MVAQDDAKQSREGGKEGWSEMSSTSQAMLNACWTAHKELATLFA